MNSHDDAVTDSLQSQLTAVLAFAAWTLLHIVIIIGFRNYMIHKENMDPTTLKKSRNEPETTLYGRVSASHANCIENLTVFAVVVCVHTLLVMLGKTSSPAAIDGLAWKYMYCRIGQSLVHWYGATNAPVVTRFLMFLCQLILIFVMIFRTYSLV